MGEPLSSPDELMDAACVLASSGPVDISRVGPEFGSPSRDGVGREVRKPLGWSPELRVRVLQKVEFNR